MKQFVHEISFETECSVSFGCDRARKKTLLEE